MNVNVDYYLKTAPHLPFARGGLAYPSGSSEMKWSHLDKFLNGQPSDPLSGAMHMVRNADGSINKEYFSPL